MGQFPIKRKSHDRAGSRTRNHFESSPIIPSGWPILHFKCSYLKSLDENHLNSSNCNYARYLNAVIGMSFNMLCVWFCPPTHVNIITYK